MESQGNAWPCDSIALARAHSSSHKESYYAYLIAHTPENEVNPDPDDPTTAACETFELVHSFGYEIYWFDGNSILRREPGQRSQNYFSSLPIT
jgi:hypothetical protein